MGFDWGRALEAGADEVIKIADREDKQAQRILEMKTQWDYQNARDKTQAGYASDAATLANDRLTDREIAGREFTGIENQANRDQQIEIAKENYKQGNLVADRQIEANKNLQGQNQKYLTHQFDENLKISKQEYLLKEYEAIDRKKAAGQLYEMNASQIDTSKKITKLRSEYDTLLTFEMTPEVRKKLAAVESSLTAHGVKMPDNVKDTLNWAVQASKQQADWLATMGPKARGEATVLSMQQFIDFADQAFENKNFQDVNLEEIHPELAAATGPQGGNVKTITTRAEFDALPSGAKYIRNGTLTTKP